MNQPQSVFLRGRPPAVRPNRQSTTLLLNRVRPTKAIPAVDESLWQAVEDASGSITRVDPYPTNVAGSFGEVFIGTHKQHGRVALKRARIPPEHYTADVLKAFLREAGLWQQLQHNHVLRFIGIYRISGDMYLVSPWMDNGAITQYVSRHPEADRLTLLHQTADALAWLHSKGVIHGDVKGANVLMDADRTPRLCDFGLTKLENTKGSDTDAVSWSLRWCSPELLDGGRREARSDVWAFGMTMWEVLTGHIPYFKYEHDDEVATAIRRAELPRTEPMFALNGSTYYRAWRAARHCWIKNSNTRPAMARIVEMVKKPNEDHDVTQPADQSAPASEDEEDSYRVLDSDDELSPESYPCYCGWHEDKTFTTCANTACELRWFHLDCIGLVSAPEVWYCMACEVKQLEGSHGSL